MPTYEYRCRDCGHELEVKQSFDDAPLTECPSCDGTLRKVFGSVGIAFRGSGFYKTDSRSNGSSKNGSSESSTKSESTTSESKSESKSETKKSESKKTDSPAPAST